MGRVQEGGGQASGDCHHQEAKGGGEEEEEEGEVEEVKEGDHSVEVAEQREGQEVGEA